MSLDPEQPKAQQEINQVTDDADDLDAWNQFHF